MPHDDLAPLTETMEEELEAHNLYSRWRERMADYGVVAFWRRCTLNTNRAVALVRAPDRAFEIGPYCQWLKWRLMWQTRFVPFFYEVGLQIVLCGSGLKDRFDTPKPLKSYVDMVSNQFVVLQSLFAVDTDSKQFAGARTWGQLITGPVQDSIARALRAAGFEPRESE
jgi:hypothetical protein